MDTSQPCVQCYGPTGMAPLDVATIPPGCMASLAVLCADCNRRRKELSTHPVGGDWKGDR